MAPPILRLPASATDQYNEDWVRKVAEADNSVDVRSILHPALSNSPDPHSTALRLIVAPGDFGRSGTPRCMSARVAQEIDNWTRVAYSAGLPAPGEAIADVAFSVVIGSSNQHIQKAVCNAFHLKKYGAKFVTDVAAVISRGDLKTAIRLIKAFSIEQEFVKDTDMYACAALLDEVALLEMFAGKDKAIQRGVLEYLNKICAEKFFLADLVNNKYGVMKVKGSAGLHRKALLKHGMRMLKKWDLDANEYPHIADSQLIAGTRYLFHRYYDSRELELSMFLELLSVAVGTNDRLHPKVLEMFNQHQDWMEGAKWVRDHPQIAQSDIPNQMNKYLEVNPHKDEPSQPLEDWDDSGAAGASQAQLLPRHRGNTTTATGGPPQQLRVVTQAEMRPKSLRRPGGAGGGKPVVDYHKLPQSILESGIVWVETPELYQTAMEEMMSASVVGLDAEWKPSFGMGQDAEGMAILQMATRKKVYILDMLTLLRVLTKADWTMLHNFLTASVKKLGFGFDSDLKKLRAVSPVFTDLKPTALVDLHPVFVKHFKGNSTGTTSPAAAPAASSAPAQRGGAWSRRGVGRGIGRGRHFDTTESEAPPPEKGLSEVTASLLGKPLDKTNQVSNWELRPLRESQIHYAALDAFCLIEVMDVMEEKLGDDLLNITKVMGSPDKQTTGTDSSASGGGVGQGKGKGRGKGRVTGDVDRVCYNCTTILQPTPPLPSQPVSVSEAPMFLVDTMLAGLGYELRAVGVDTIIMAATTGDDRRDALIHTHSRYPDRLVLSTGDPYKRALGLLPENTCYKIDLAANARFQLEAVLAGFNVRVTGADLFSRCKFCNCPKYFKVSSEDMSSMIDRWGKSTSGSKQWSLRLEDIANSDAGEVHTKDEVTSKRAAVQIVERKWGLLSTEAIPEEAEIADTIIKESATLSTGVSLQMDKISKRVTPTVDEFYVCRRCGKIYWEGLHWQRVAQKYSKVTGGEVAVHVEAQHTSASESG